MSGAVFVTGGTGLVGGALLDRLQGAGMEVRALARDLARARSAGPQSSWIEGDLLRPESYAGALEGCEIVLHCAGAMLADEGNRAINRDATRALAEQAGLAGVKRFAYLSSCAVYGDDAHHLVAEDAPVAASSPYGRSKVEAEHALRRAAREHDFEVCILRPCMISGPRDRNLAPAIAALVSQPVVVLPGGAHKHIEIVHARDVAEALVRGCIEGLGRGTYNLTAGLPRPLREVLQSAAQALGAAPQWRDISLAEAEEELRLARESGSPPPFPPVLHAIAACERTYSIEKARREIGYAPRVETCPVAEALRSD